MNLLLIEDNPGDVRLTKEALKENNIHLDLKIAYDGEQALQYLLKEKEYMHAETPDLIIMDINLPKKNGIEVLEKIKADNRLKRIPVIMLTTSDTYQDIDKCYALHANAYIIKPIDFDQFVAIIKSIYEFWFIAVKLPTVSNV
jgi:two-component system response regulator